MLISMYAISISFLIYEPVLSSKRVVEVENLDCCKDNYYSTLRLIHDTDSGLVNLQNLIRKEEDHPKKHVIEKREPQKKEKNGDDNIREMKRIIFDYLRDDTILRERYVKLTLKDMANVASHLIDTESDVIYYRFADLVSQKELDEIIEVKNNTMRKIKTELKKAYITSEDISKDISATLNQTEYNLENMFQNCLGFSCFTVLAQEPRPFVDEFLSALLRLKTSSADRKKLQEEGKKNIYLFISKFRSKMMYLSYKFEIINTQ